MSNSEPEGDTTKESGPSGSKGVTVGPNGKKIGRPRKSAVQAKKAGNRGKVGRPKGDAAIMNEYRARMIASPKSKAVLQKVLDTALNDEHKHQAACMKMVMDRLLPVSGFEQNVTKEPSGGLIVKIQTTTGNVTVGGDMAVPGKEERADDMAIEAEFSEVGAEES